MSPCFHPVGYGLFAYTLFFFPFGVATLPFTSREPKANQHSPFCPRGSAPIRYLPRVFQLVYNLFCFFVLPYSVGASFPCSGSFSVYSVQIKKFRFSARTAIFLFARPTISHRRYEPRFSFFFGKTIYDSLIGRCPRFPSRVGVSAVWHVWWVAPSP